MGQKVNPIGFRLPVTKDWKSRWFARKAQFGPLLQEDLKIREKLTKELSGAAVSKIVIERFAKRVRVTIFTGRPGIIMSGKFAAPAAPAAAKKADAAAAAPAAAPAAVTRPPAVPAVQEPAKPAPAAPAAGLDPAKVIESPTVGTFYRSPSPGAEPFVKVGSHVEADTTVAVVEAMKVMNEIKAETSGVIKKVLVDNAMAVQYGQPLFLVGQA